MIYHVKLEPIFVKYFLALCISKWIICNDVIFSIKVFLSAYYIQLSGVINNKYPFVFNNDNDLSIKSLIRL